MPFREKSAWITLISMLASFGAYYGLIVARVVSPHGRDTLHLLFVCVGALVALQIILHVLAATLSPREANTAADERERHIRARALGVGYYVLVCWVLLLAAPVMFGHPVADILNFALLGVVLAELTVAGSQIVLFRRGG